MSTSKLVQRLRGVADDHSSPDGTITFTGRAALDAAEEIEALRIAVSELLYTSAKEDYDYAAHMDARLRAVCLLRGETVPPRSTRLQDEINKIAAAEDEAERSISQAILRLKRAIPETPKPSSAPGGAA